MESMDDLLTHLLERNVILDILIRQSDEILSLREVAVLLRKNEGSLFSMLCIDHIPYYRAGNSITFLRDELVVWIIQKIQQSNSSIIYFINKNQSN